MTLSNAAVEREIAHARLQVRLAELRLRNSSSPAAQIGEPDERELASAAILKNKKEKLRRYRALFATRDIAEQELREAENEYANARRDLLAEQERRSATVPQDRNLIELELQRAMADEQYAESRLALLRLISPQAGSVLRVHVAVGDNIFPRDPLVEISDSSRMTVRATVAPELLRYVRTGMTVNVKVFTVPPRQFREAITSIVPASGETPAAIRVAVPNPDGTIQSGTPAAIVLR